MRCQRFVCQSASKGCLVLVVCAFWSCCLIRTASDLSLVLFWAQSIMLQALFLLLHLAFRHIWLYTENQWFHFHIGQRLKLQVTVVFLVQNWGLHRCLHVYGTWKKHIMVPTALGQICCSQVWAYAMDLCIPHWSMKTELLLLTCVLFPSQYFDLVLIK